MVLEPSLNGLVNVDLEHVSDCHWRSKFTGEFSSTGGIVFGLCHGTPSPFSGVEVEVSFSYRNGSVYAYMNDLTTYPTPEGPCDRGGRNPELETGESLPPPLAISTYLSFSQRTLVDCANNILEYTGTGASGSRGQNHFWGVYCNPDGDWFGEPCDCICHASSWGWRMQSARITW
jgi:hypothetical protein